MDILTNLIIKGWVLYCSQKAGVDPAFALAVAHVESRKGAQEFRVGRLGRSRFWGPMGLNDCFRSRWDITDYLTNIEIGCKALRGPQERVLRRYNAEYSDSYGKAVRAAMRAYQREWGKL